MILPIDPDCLSVEAIQHKASALGLTITDAEQINFLQRTDTFDLQAAPGCGKTTLTGLKLCLIASGWQSLTQGVCVLSHTNVAKKQIMDILARDTDGSRFLTYPHFIGTIQTFVDTFLAFPHLRSDGIEIRIIDPDIYARVALKELNLGPYPNLKTLSTRRPSIQPLVSTARYFWRDGALTVAGTVNQKLSQFPFGVTAPSTQEFIALKEKLKNRGIFGYEDMYGFAFKYLETSSHTTSAIRLRFPFVLIDEMQDTDNVQDSLLTRLFGSGKSALQRIGDVNQRIYSGSDHSEEGSSTFPIAGCDSLPKSKRFGTGIAKLASKLTCTSPQVLQGDSERTDIPPTLILFEPKSVSMVLSTFAKLAYLQLDSSQRSTLSIKAVCARKSSNADEFPTHLTTYWPEYRPSAVRPGRTTRLIAAVQKVKLGRSVAWHEHFQVLMESCCDILTQWGWKIDERRPRPHSLRNFLLKANASESLPVRRALLGLQGIDLVDQPAWEAAVQQLLSALAMVCGLEEPPEKVLKYCEHCSDLILAPGDAKVCTSAEFEIEGEKLTVELDTIHASKGETHAATLVLESFNSTYDLKEVLPILIGKENRQRVSKTKAVQAAIRTTFVGMTRPKHMICFAVRKSHIEAHLAEFERQGWVIHDLTVD
jgi:hypothetical protein